MSKVGKNPFLTEFTRLVSLFYEILIWPKKKKKTKKEKGKKGGKGKRRGGGRSGSYRSEKRAEALLASAFPDFRHPASRARS